VFRTFALVTYESLVASKPSGGKRITDLLRNRYWQNRQCKGLRNSHQKRLDQTNRQDARVINTAQMAEVLKAECLFVKDHPESGLGRREQSSAYR
jgi:hypothetical protein